MTFKESQFECYVYITLPGQTNPVTAGRFSISINQRGIPTGRFFYGKQYLARPDAIPFDPVELLLTPNTYETITLKGVFGVLRDAGPDYWGRRIIEKNVQKLQLSEIDYLLNSADDRAGALGFGLNKTPPAPQRHFNKTIELAKLLTIIERILKDEEILSNSDNNQVKELMLIGTSMGGARPKTVVEDNNGLWIAKFNRSDDKWDNAAVEHAMLTLARECGITSAESRIVNVKHKNILLVKRFDREKTQTGYLRARMISALTLLRGDETYNNRDKWSYILLADELRRCCSEPKKNNEELFKRICFNALISNTDDHPRNHAVIAKEYEWKLSPAYDLTVSIPISTERRDLAMICGDAGRYANAKNLLSQHSRFLLDKEQATNIIENMEQQIQNTWYATARSCGVSERDCDVIKNAFDYPGFNLQLLN